MAKKKAARKKVTRKAAKKKVAAKSKPKPARKAAKKKAAAKKRKVARKAVKKKATSAARKKKVIRKIKSKSLGRPRIAGDAKLDQFFQKDYQAREIFEFLGVHTLRELETFGPDEIIEKLTGPMVQTVQRIRKTLAMVNRSLANDRDFALDFKSRL